MDGKKKDGAMYGMLLHLSYNMWCDKHELRDLNEKRRYPIPSDITGERRKKLEYNNNKLVNLKKHQWKVF